MKNGLVHVIIQSPSTLKMKRFEIYTIIYDIISMMTIIMIKHCIYKSIERGIVIIERVYLCPVSTQLCIREGGREGVKEREERGVEGEGGIRRDKGSEGEGGRAGGRERERERKEQMR